MSYMSVGGRSDALARANDPTAQARLASALEARRKRQAENAALTGQAKIDFDAKMAGLNRQNRKQEVPEAEGNTKSRLPLYLILAAGAGTIWFLFLRKK